MHLIGTVSLDRHKAALRLGHLARRACSSASS